MSDQPINQPLKALVIEPSAIVRQVFGTILQKQGFHVDAFEKGEEALSIFNEKQYDMVCIALLLPDMSGMDVCRTIRSLNQTKRNTPVVLITSEDDKNTLLQVLKAGATEIFKKNDVLGFDSYLTQFVWNTVESKSLYGKVLYVEDSRAITEMIKSLLTLNGMDVDHFTTAEEAYEAFLANDYDLVISDIILEGEMTGSQLVQKIRSDRSNNPIPILAISGVEDSSRRVSLLKAGVNDYVAKPIMNDELIARVQNLLRSKKLFDRVQEQQEALRELAMKDQLTGLYNRHFLMEMGPKRIREAQRHKHSLSMVVVDLDKFKTINDTHGHSTGDIVLKEVGGLLQRLSRKEDLASRFGGEEFVLVLAHCDLGDAMDKAEKIRKEIMELKPAGLDITASFGVSTLMDTDEDMPQLFERADQAVYQSKHDGRNRVTSV
jgi:two-component system cell cycle response regulator